MVLGIDPGRDKTGFAFVNSKDGNLIASGIFKTEDENFFSEFFDDKKVLDEKYFLEKKTDIEIKISDLEMIFIGNGTTSKNFFENNFLRKKIDVKIYEIDEKNTTLDARNLYWKIHKPGLLKSFLPMSMRVPSRKLDDLAAWAIALRGLKIYGYMLKDKL